MGLLLCQEINTLRAGYGLATVEGFTGVWLVTKLVAGLSSGFVQLLSKLLPVVL